MGPLTDLLHLLRIIHGIHIIGQTVEGNKQRCEVLRLRCEAFRLPLQMLQERLSINESIVNSTALSNLIVVLNECKDFMTKYGQPGYKRFFMNIADHASVKDQFKSLNLGLSNAALDLNFLITVDNAAAQRADEADSAELLSMMKQMIESQEVKLNQVGGKIEDQIQLMLQNFNALFSQNQKLLNLIHQPEEETTSKPDSPVPFASSTAPKPSINSVMLKRLELNLDELKFDQCSEVLGQGSFGKVVKGLYGGDEVAVKQIEGAGILLTPKETRVVQREALIMSTINHPNVIRFFGLSIERGLLVMELAHASLFDVLHREKELPFGLSLSATAVKGSVVLDVAKALHYLHLHDIIHRDVKSQNVLLSAAADGSRLIAKLGDFGVALANGFTMTGGTATKTAAGAIGSRPYMAPELVVFEGDGVPAYTAAVDMYAYGILVNEVFTGAVPWAGLNDFQLLNKIYTQQLPPLFTPTCPEEVSLLAIVGDATRGCLANAAGDRLGSGEVKATLLELFPTQQRSYVLLPEEMTPTATAVAEEEASTSPAVAMVAPPSPPPFSVTEGSTKLTGTDFATATVAKASPQVSYSKSTGKTRSLSACVGDLEAVRSIFWTEVTAAAANPNELCRLFNTRMRDIFSGVMWVKKQSKNYFFQADFYPKEACFWIDARYQTRALYWSKFSKDLNDARFILLDPDAAADPTEKGYRGRLQHVEQFDSVAKIVLTTTTGVKLEITIENEVKRLEFLYLLRTFSKSEIDRVYALTHYSTLAWNLGKVAVTCMITVHDTLYCGVSPFQKFTLAATPSEGPHVIQAFDIRTGEVLCSYPVAHEKWISAIVLHGDHTLISGGCDNLVKIWDIANGKTELYATLKGHTESIACIAVYDGNKLLTAAGKCIKMWDMTHSYRLLHTWYDPVCEITSFVVYGSRLYSAGQGWGGCAIKGELLSFDLATYKATRQILFRSDKSRVESLYIWQNLLFYCEGQRLHALDLSNENKEIIDYFPKITTNHIIGSVGENKLYCRYINDIHAFTLTPIRATLSDRFPTLPAKHVTLSNNGVLLLGDHHLDAAYYEKMDGVDYTQGFKIAQVPLNQ